MTVLAQDPVPDDLLPFGWVDCGVIDVVGDDTSDDDQDPGSVPVAGDGLIVFIPKVTEMRVMRNGRSTLVRNRPVPANLDQDGVIELAGHRLVKLWHGVWTCTPGNRNILDFDQFDFELTGDYTLASPAPLWHIAPYDPPDGVTVTTMEVPSGQQPGETLYWDGSKLAWGATTITPTVTTLPSTSNATASFAGQWPNLTLALGLPRGADGQPSASRIIGAGRPDMPATLTAGVAAQVAAAPVGSNFSSTDGASVGAWEWQKRPAGWYVTLLDTGWRDIKSLLVNGWTATTFVIQRSATSLSLIVEGLTSSAMTSAVVAAGLPVGMRFFGARARLLLHTLDSPAKTYRLTPYQTTDQIYLPGATTSTPTLYGTVTISMAAADQCPTTLPGVGISV